MYSSVMDNQRLGICVSATHGDLDNLYLSRLSDTQFFNSVHGVVFTLPEKCPRLQVSNAMIYAYFERLTFTLQ